MTYNLTPPASGWPDGTYKVVATMMDNGTQRDQKTVTFTVGNAAAAPADNSATSSADSSATSSSQ
ncbi:MAG: hypothetical protein JO199_08855 [Candidatus Eremiobacteraeota bacterium]|nr:hypothetical protein [Candidatus Eremiobacteraeota bacterium]